jgi:flagellar hook-associated protein 2
MATISSAGLGSGLDVESIVTQLMAIERRPISLLKDQTKQIETQLSAFGKLQGALSTMRDKARALTASDAWSPTKASSADEASVSVSTGTGSVPGSYAVSVAQLAKAQTMVSGTFAGSEAVVGAGTLAIQLGTWAGTAFTPRTGSSAVNVTVAADDTLQDVRDKINGADAGVVASIVNDANGARLTLRSTTSGEDYAFRLAVTDADGNAGDAAGLSALAYDPGGAGAVMTRTQVGSNARATINGVAIESNTNTLENVIDGLTVRLGKVTTGDVDVAVTQDSEAIKTAVTDFANAYNELIKQIREQTKFNEGSKTGAPLQGDRAAIALQQQLRSLLGGVTGASAVFQRMADIGLDPQSDGTLTVRASKLDGAVANARELEKFFANVDAAQESNNGFAQVLRKFADELLGTDGSLTTKQESLRTRIARNGAREAQLEERMTLVEKRMRAQYTSLDTQMAKLNSLSTYMTRQLSALSSYNGNKS